MVRDEQADMYSWCHTVATFVNAIERTESRPNGTPDNVAEMDADTTFVSNSKLEHNEIEQQIHTSGRTTH